MTKAPFASVAWLSQSSRDPQGDPSVQEAASAPCPEGIAVAQQGEEPLAHRPAPGKESLPSGGQIISSAQGAPSEHQVPKDRGASSASSPPAIVAPKREWSASECGSDGEGNLSEGQTPESGGGGGGRSPSTRRLRTAFSLEQISTLESSFKRHRYLGAAERRKLASKMQLSEVQIKTWFQNRRMKLKRQMQEMRPEIHHAVPFYSPLAFGPQSGPLSYVYSPHQQTLSRREAPIPSGLPFPPLPAPPIDPRNTSAGQPGALWPMPLPYLLGYQDPRTVFMAL